MLAEEQPVGITTAKATQIAGSMGLLLIAGIGIGVYILYSGFIKR